MKHLWMEKGGYADKKSRHFLAYDFHPEKIKKIAVLRHAALGDQVITRPFLVELQRFFPNAVITLSGSTNYQYGAPVDLVHHTHWVYCRDMSKKVSIKERFKRFRALGDQDIVFDLAATNRSIWTMLLNKSALKIGIPFRLGLNKKIYNMAVYRSDQVPEVETMLNTLRILGHTPSYPLDFAMPSYEKASDIKKRIVYFNGASQERKKYPEDKHFTMLEKAIKHLPDFQHIFLEGLSEREKADHYRTLEQHHNFAIQPCLSLEDLTDYLSESSLIVCTDTGVRNIAIATHTPTVGIFFATVPFRYTPQNGKHHIVMKPDASIPEPEHALTTIKKALNLSI